jgi:hypothetical protein
MMDTFYVWAAMDSAHDYLDGDTVPNGAGAYLYAGDTLEAARAAMVSDPATYQTAHGDAARLYIAVSDGEELPRIVSGPHTGSAWPMPYVPKRYTPALSAFIALGVTV